jgi:hypothetical protein
MKQKREKDDKKFYVGEAAVEGETASEALTGCRLCLMQELRRGLAGVVLASQTASAASA